MDLLEVVEGAVGPFEDYCDGYGNPGASGGGYLSAVALQLGVADQRYDAGLDSIVAFDRASATGTYSGQINMLAASSFSGANGALWGFDIARADNLSRLEPLFFQPRQDGVEIPVYDADLLLEASRRLLGTRDQRRFCLLPGALVPAALKGTSVIGPTQLWCALGLAIVEDRERSANLFLEDMGTLAQESDLTARRLKEQRDLAAAAIAVGVNQDVLYRAIFVGFAAISVGKGEVGAAKVFAPYLVLAQKAVPPKGAASLLDLSLSEWERAVGLIP